MKKTIVIVTLWLLIIGYAYSQSASRGNYYPIDPYDYKLSIESAKPGIARLYKSTVLFSMQMGTNFYFKSLDGSTTLSMEAKKRFQPMNDGQKVTIYYTATRSSYVALDTVVLDDIDYENSSEVVTGKKTPADSPQIDRTNYQAIDPYDYKLSIESAKPGIARLYKSTVLFSMQMGTNFYFKSLDGSTTLSMEAKKRFQPMNDGQKVTIYYTATRSPYVALDTVILDDIDY